MDISKIKVKYADTGYYLARCDHSTGVIELNRRVFSRLDPIMRDYIWCHEYVHLLCDIHDEAKCNETTARVFVARAKNETDRQDRIKFVEASHVGEGISGLDPVSAVVSMAVSIVVKTAKDVARSISTNRNLRDYLENGGFNALDSEKQVSLVDAYLEKAFKASRRVSDRSARDFFWLYMEPIVDGTYDSTYYQFISRHRWVLDHIAKYEKEYGFAIDEVLPADSSDIYKWIAVGTVAAIAIIYLIKKLKK